MTVSRRTVMALPREAERYIRRKQYGRRVPLASLQWEAPIGEHCLSSGTGLSNRLTVGLTLIRVLDNLEIRDCKHCEDLRFALLAYMKNL